MVNCDDYKARLQAWGEARVELIMQNMRIIMLSSFYFSAAQGGVWTSDWPYICWSVVGCEVCTVHALPSTSSLLMSARVRRAATGAEWWVVSPVTVRWSSLMWWERAGREEGVVSSNVWPPALPALICMLSTPDTRLTHLTHSSHIPTPHSLTPHSLTPHILTPYLLTSLTHTSLHSNTCQ